MPVSFHIHSLMNSSKSRKKKPCCTDLFIKCVLGQIFSWYKLAGLITTSGLLNRTGWESGPTRVRTALRNWIAGNNAPVLSPDYGEVCGNPDAHLSDICSFNLLPVTCRNSTEAYTVRWRIRSTRYALKKESDFCAAPFKAVSRVYGVIDSEPILS